MQHCDKTRLISIPNSDSILKRMLNS